MTDEHPPESPTATDTSTRRRLRPFVAVAVLVAAVGVALAISSESPRAIVAEAGSAGPTTTAPPEPEPTTTTTAAPTTTTSMPASSTTTEKVRVEPQATRHAVVAVPPRPGIRLTVLVDRPVVHSGERFGATLIIENGSSHDLVYHGHPCVAFHQGIYEHGRWIGGQRMKNCTHESPPPIVVEPGRSKEVHREFDTLSHDDSPLPPGVYQVGVGIHQRDADNREVAWFAPAVDLEIRAAS